MIVIVALAADNILSKAKTLKTKDSELLFKEDYIIDVTRKLHLFPFDLPETQEFLESIGVHLKKSQILEIYMALGGVAHYLKQVQHGLSARQNIARICFSRNGYLRDEFNILFQSLFAHAENHIKIINALAKKKSGLSRNEIINETGFPSGGRLDQWLEELEKAGFIAALIPHGKVEKNIHYRIIDEYTWFHLKWIKKAPKNLTDDEAEAYWEKISGTPSYISWAGFAFEALCFKHQDRIKKTLGIQGITQQSSSWAFIPPAGNTEEKGAQIDLLFDRSDGAITLIEIKYCSSEYSLDKSYAFELKHKIETFQAKTKTKKQLFLTLITPYGMKSSIWAEGLIQQVVTVEDLFR